MCTHLIDFIVALLERLMKLFLLLFACRFIIHQMLRQMTVSHVRISKYVCVCVCVCVRTCMFVGLEVFCLCICVRVYVHICV